MNEEEKIQPAPNTEKAVHPNEIPAVQQVTPDELEKEQADKSSEPEKIREQTSEQPAEQKQPETAQIKDMEVHHHTHPGHHKKKWTDYFWEFLMLFLAVFCGFLAEYQLEHKIEKEKEKQAIESLVRCLVSDTIQIKHVIDANIKVVGHLDSLLKFRNADLNDPVNKKNFLMHSIVGFSEDWYFRTNDAAIQQLKSSGLLRLIRKQNIIDSIFKYDFDNKTLAAQETDCYFLFKEAFLDFKDAVDLSFYRDTGIFKYSFGYDNSALEIKNIDAVQLSTDNDKIKILFGNAGMMTGPNVAYIHLMQEQLVNGKNLIAILKKEYFLK